MMSEAQEDTRRALEAAKAIVDHRRASADFAAIMVTLEHAVATVLIALMPDTRKAAAMLNEGLVPGVEARISLYLSKEPKP